MNFFTRISNGWELAKTSMKVLTANKQLIIFPILSGLSMLAIVGSFLWFLFPRATYSSGNIDEMGRGALYLLVFAFYLVNYFIVSFFNMGLMHCTKLYLEGEEASVARGLQFSASRIGAIFAWSVFAATVGTLLKLIQDNAGWLGKILVGLVGIVWSVATYFAVPVIAYENVGPIDAVKRSAQIMKDNWGEKVGASFSFGLIAFCATVLCGIIGMGLSAVNETIGIIFFVAGILAIFPIVSALNSIFISALYHHVSGNLDAHFDQQLLNSLFESKDK